MSVEHERLAKAKEIFADAIERAPGARSAHVEAACAGNSELREMVQALLSAHDAAARFMDAPSMGLQGGATASMGAAALEEPGSVIGRYKLLERIGEGGFGVVFMAEQSEPVVRRVALKVIKAGMDTHQVVARFEAERQALAMMDHPNIAKVLDAGATETGRPFFVMELVRGDPITEYCDRNNLTTGERLSLFTDVCHAVQHAHQKGIIHRDIKPSNVLVTMFDGRPVPKVIDFGIAKAMHQRLTEKTLFTAHRHLIGTPQYMSPEQAEMSGVDIDTRSDIYSLGVLLYELLTGTTPFDPEHLRSAALAEVQRIIREEEPEKPSTRLSQGVKAPRSQGIKNATPEAHAPPHPESSKPRQLDTTSVATHRRTDPAQLVRSVRGDLDWIVMKCLEKDRTRRYETADGLALDVQRHVSGDPVVAAPPSRVYRARKFVRRNRGPVTAGGLIAAALVLGLLGTTAGLLQAREQRDRAVLAEQDRGRERDRANATAVKARRITEYLQRILGSADPHEESRSPDFTVRQLIDDVAKSPPGQLADEPDTEAVVRLTIAAAYQHLAQYADAHKQLDQAQALLKSDALDDVRAQILIGRADLLHDEGNYADAATCARQALALARTQHEPENLTLFHGLDTLADLERHLGNLAEAESLAREVLSHRNNGADNRSVSVALNCLAHVLMEKGDYAGAEKVAREGLALHQKAQGPEHLEVASAMAMVAHILSARDDAEGAERLARDALAIQRRILGDAHPRVATTLTELGNMLIGKGDSVSAEPLAREALAIRRNVRDGSPAVCPTLTALARILMDKGEYGEAESLLREVLALRRKQFGPDDSNVAPCLNNLASLLAQKGDLAAAVPVMREALALDRKRQDAEPLNVATTLANLAVFLTRLGNHEEAAAMAREALLIQRQHLGDEHTSVANTMGVLAGALAGGGDLAAAEALQRESLDLKRKLLGMEHPSVSVSMDSLGEILRLQGKYQESADLIRQSISLTRVHLGHDHPRIAKSLDSLAATLASGGDYQGAVSLLREALDLRIRLYQENHPDVAANLHRLGSILAAHEDYAAAEPYLRQALDIRRRLFGADHASVGATLRVLAVVVDRNGDPVEAARLLGEAMAMQRRLLPERSPELANAAAQIGFALLKMESIEAARAAEPLLGESLEIRRRHYPEGHADEWVRFNTMSLLGESLSRQGKFIEAEPLLLEGYNGLVSSTRVPTPVPLLDHRRDALERIASLYESWDRAEPGKGHDAKAREWRERLGAGAAAPSGRP